MTYKTDGTVREPKGLKERRGRVREERVEKGMY